MHVDSNFLNSVESAWKGAQVILALYKDMNVQPLIESQRKDVDLDNGGRFLREVANSEKFELLSKPIKTAVIKSKPPIVVLLRNELDCATTHCWHMLLHR